MKVGASHSFSPDFYIPAPGSASPRARLQQGGTMEPDGMPTTLQQRSGGSASSMDATLMPPSSSAPPGAPAGDEGVTLSLSHRASRSAAQASRGERRCATRPRFLFAPMSVIMEYRRRKKMQTKPLEKWVEPSKRSHRQPDIWPTCERGQVADGQDTLCTANGQPATLQGERRPRSAIVSVFRSTLGAATRGRRHATMLWSRVYDGTDGRGAGDGLCATNVLDSLFLGQW